MKFLLSILLLLASMASMAQAISGTITGTASAPLPYATVQLTDANGKLVKIETSDQDGKFVVSGIPAGFYRIQVGFVGYGNYTDSLELGAETVSLGVIALVATAATLNAVDVVEEKQMIEAEHDKMVFNVSKDLTATGENGLELLRKSPGVQVDNNDNIVVEGKTGVLVYINGKQSYLSGEDLSAYLKSLQAEEVEKIEIITQPSAKYDAAGSAGVINIVLKREKGFGTRGSASTTFTMGDFGRSANTLSINNRSRKLNVFGAYTGYTGSNTRFMDLYREQAGNIFESETDTKFGRNNNSVRMGGDYYLSPKSTIGAVVSYNRNLEDRSVDSETLIINGQTAVTDSLLSAQNEMETDVTNLMANLNYTYQDTVGRTFSIDLDYVDYDRIRDSSQPNIYTSPDGEVTSDNSTFQRTPIDIQVFSVKSDYEFKLWNGNLGFGAKYSTVNTNNVFDFYNIVGGDRVINTDRSNTFDYQEDVTAAYVNYNFKKKKWTYQAGVRMEHTLSIGKLTSLQEDQNQTVERNYANWFPSAGITFQPSRVNSLALQYSRRIRRPNYENLNPFEYQQNELSFVTGNPFLQPQFTENIKLSNTYKYRLTTSFTFSYVSDYFAQVTEEVGSNKTSLIQRNVADQQTYSFSVSYPTKITKWWNVYANASLTYNAFTANTDAFLPIDQTTFNTYAQNTFTLPKDFRFAVSGWWNSASIWGGTYRVKPLGALNLAVSKDWNQWTAKLSFNDIFHSIPWRGQTRYGDLFIDGTGGGDSRNVRIFLQYKFGHKDVKGERKRDSGSESERERISD